MSHPVPTMEYNDPATYDEFVATGDIQHEFGNIDEYLNFMCSCEVHESRKSHDTDCVLYTPVCSCPVEAWMKGSRRAYGQHHELQCDYFQDEYEPTNY